MSRKYQIQSGETLFAISKRFYGEPTYFGLIAAFNNLTDPNKIAPGQTISIPELPDHWDVVQVTGTNSIGKTGVFSLNIGCHVPAAMRLVIETVSGRLVQQRGVMSSIASAIPTSWLDRSARWRSFHGFRASTAAIFRTR